MGKKKHVYRIGDRVKIIKPEIFIRCGYPMSIETIVKELDQKLGWDLIRTALGITDEGLTSIEVSTVASRAHLKIMYGLALAVGHYRGWGGNERRIYTETKPELEGKEMIVSGKRRVVTGVRIPGSGGYGYDGYDYDPPCLAKEKHHVILKGWWYLSEEFEIEESNVLPIGESENEYILPGE